MEPQKNRAAQTDTIKSVASGYFFAIAAAAITAFVVRAFLFEAYRIPTEFMSPALLPGDHIFVNKLAYRRYGVIGPHESPKRGDVVVFSFPTEPNKDFIKRVIAIEGDTVEIQDDVVFLNGKAISVRSPDTGVMDEVLGGRRFKASWIGADAATIHKMSAVRVPDDQFFVLGDNRVRGQDSRTWGFVSSRYLKGRAGMIWFSSSKQGTRWDRVLKGVE